MAHFGLLWKARTIEKHRQKYENEKINSIFMSRSDMPDKTLFQKFKHYKQGMQKRLSRTFSKWYPEGSTVSNFFVNLRADMKLPSILLRGFYGFIGGLCLTYLGFMFFVFQLSLSVMNATVLSSVLGVLVTLGLTFSNRMRCLIFLLAPQLFSRVGRYTLTCYALVLILTGPATNTLRNCELLSTSMAATQEQIKLSVKQINDSIKKPYNSIKSSLKITIASMKTVVMKLKKALIRINRLILSMASVIESNFKWFIYVADISNDAVGTPHEKCLNIMKKNSETIKTFKPDHMPKRHVKKSTKDYLRDLLHAFGIKNVKSHRKDDVEFDFGSFKRLKSNPIMENMKEAKDNYAKRDSKNRKGPKEEIKDTKPHTKEQPWFLNKDKLHKAVCASLKSYDKFFVPADFAEVTYVATIRKKLKTFVSRLNELLHANLNIQHTYSFVGNSSTGGHVACGVVTEIKSRADPILTWLSWSSCVTSLFLLLIIFRAKHYQRMFETRPRFDNRFITKEFRELDLKRLREGRETVLPLNARERAKYVTTTSFRLVASEKLHLNRSAVFMTVTTFKLLIHIVADYSLYWVLATIRYHGAMQAPVLPPTTNTDSSIPDSGFVSRMLQSFVSTMNAELLFPPPDKSCLPDPYPPDVKRYCQIGFLIVLLWFFALFEPYGLRMRHLIMGHYRSQRARDRAQWLYNHILRTRATFMKYARRKLHLEHKYSNHRHMTLHRWLQSYNIFRWLYTCVGVNIDANTRCLLCNITEDKNIDNMEMIRCEVPNCPGNYCPSCFGDIGQLCTICLSPTDYGDFSDASLEIGSSDDEDNNISDRNRNRDANRRNDKDQDDKGFQTGSYFMEEQIDDEQNSSRRISKQKYYTLGRKGENNETIPLLKHSENGNKNSYTNDELHKDLKTEELQSICFMLCNNLKEIDNNIEKEKLKDFIFKFEFTPVFNIIQYSIYEITQNPLSIMKYRYSSDFGTYLRKKKLIRRKKYVFNEDTFWQKISKTTFREVAKKHGSDDDGPKGTKIYLNKSRKISTKHAFNINPKDLSKKSLTYCIETKNERPITKVKKEKPKANSPFTRYWNNMKWTLFHIRTNNKRDESPIKNHGTKRKKKRKKVIDLSRSSSFGVRLRKKGNFIGNSRLFAYLDERDWVKKYESDDLTMKDPVVVKNDNIVVNNIMIPRLQLDLSAESINEQDIRDIFKNPTVSKVEGKTYSKCAIGKFVKSIICSSCEYLLFENSSMDKEKYGENVREETKPSKELDVVKKPEASSAHTKYTSHPESHSATHAKPYSSPEEHNYSFNIKRTFSNPLSLIKSIYSSISLSKFEKRPKTSRATENPIKDVNNHHKHTDDKKIRPMQMLKANIMKSKMAESNIMKTETIKSNTTKPGMSKSNIVKPDMLKMNITKPKWLESNMTKPEVLKSNLKTENKNKKPPRAVLFIKEDEEDEIKKVMPKKKVKKIENRGMQTELTFKFTDTDDKGVSVFPTMVSCGCQNVCRKHKTEDLAVQVTARSHKQGNVAVCEGFDAELMTCNNATCTCAVQCYKSLKEVGTCPSQCLALAGTLDSNDVGTVMPDRQETKQEPQSPTTSTTDTMSSETEGTKTDTTVCSLASVDYRLPQQNRDLKKRYKVKVVTKSNRSTTTERANHCDVSTATYDWWSPIVEKKVYNQEKNVVDRKKKEYDLQKMRERKTFRSKGIMAGDKTVTFRSKTQFIPSRHIGYGDIMSPSRYLLESQKYYNELFYNIFTSPRVYPMANVQKFHQQEKERSQTTSTHKRRKGRKTKRLDDSYTPRKSFQTNPWTIKVEKPERLRKNKRV